jgi:hypothetical protein
MERSEIRVQPQNPDFVSAALSDYAYFPSLRGANGSGLGRPDDKLRDEAIQSFAVTGLLRFARNDRP